MIVRIDQYLTRRPYSPPSGENAMFQRTMTLAAAALMSASALAQTADTTPKPQAPKSDQARPDVKPLTIGDPARPIDIQHWVKGDKVAEFKPGNVYVVEFWATWCPPCRDGMPHLSELQTKYKDYDVTIIGISDEDLPTVEGFLKQTNKKLSKPWNEVIQYTLATDPDKSAKTDYWVAAGQDKLGIPSAFIVGKDQKIEWIGNPHPMAGDGFDKALHAVVHDEWNRAEFKNTFEKKQAAEAENRKFQGEFGAAARAKEWDKAIALLDQAIEKNPEGADSYRVTKFQILLAEKNDASAYSIGEEIAKNNWDNPQMLNMLAWFVVDRPGIQNRNLDFALKLAGRANELTHEKDAAILDTFARVYFEKGDLKNAVRLQKKAVANAEEGEMAAQLAEALKKYEAALENNKSE
jgi:thiol-disulfide isomerase/thioredoxin